MLLHITKNVKVLNFLNVKCYYGYHDRNYVYTVVFNTGGRINMIHVGKSEK